MAHATARSKKRNVHAHDDAEERDLEPSTPPPDGGWGWVIVFASFMIHVVTDGVTYSFGVLYDAFLEYFQSGKGETSWIASLLVGVTLCSGPISSSFVNKYGCRAVTIAGSILASLCLLASFWAQNVTTLYFTIGIGTGLGFGLIYLPAIVSVTCYFERYRSLATGIAVCGSGIGTFIFAPFCEYLIATFAWRGSVMIISALVLHCIIFGALFRPLEPSKDIPLKELSRENRDEFKIVRPIGFAMEGYERPHSVSNVSHAKYHPVNTQDETTNNMRVALSQPILITRTSHHAESVTRSFGSGVMNRRDVFYQGSLDNVRHRSGSLANSEEHMRSNASLRSLPNGSGKQTDNFECLPYAEETLDILHEMLELSLLKDPVFILFTLSNFCTSIGFNVPYVYLSVQAQARGIDKKNASFLLAVIGIANTMGRIILGYVSDKPWVNRLLVYNLCLTICGLSTIFSTFCTSFESFAFYSVVFGFTAGAYVGLTSVILVDLLGLDRLTNAFGLLLLFQGLASLLGPPIAGWLYDAICSYDPGFYLAGSMITVSGVMLFLIPPIQRRIQQKTDRLKRININTVA